MHVVLPKRSSGEWRLRQNDSLKREKNLATFDPGRGTPRVEVSAWCEETWLHSTPKAVSESQERAWHSAA